MKKNYPSFLLLLLLILLPLGVPAQSRYPVLSYTQLIPPYSSDVSTFYSGSREGMVVTLTNTDLQQSLLRVRLRMQISGNQFRMHTPEYVQTPVVELQSGIPLRLSLNDLSVYFRAENLSISGGSAQFQRSKRLPDGLYRFRFEVIDAVTGKLLSNPQTGFSQVFLAEGDPPVLNLPRKGELIAQGAIPQLFFQWTPRHFNSPAAAYGTEYEFTLVEIFDKQLAPEAAFASSRLVLKETTRQTNLSYGLSHPPLLPGYRYAWQVRAKAYDPASLEEASVFKNMGCSEIFFFDYTADCKAVEVIGAVYEHNLLNITWVSTDALTYRVEYRKQGSSRWQQENAYQHAHTLSNLSPGSIYEFRIACSCAMNDEMVYSGIRSFQVPDKGAETNPQCGILPRSNLSNYDPLPTLLPGDIFYAGDFPVKVSMAESRLSGVFSGRGEVVIPYFDRALLNVRFDQVAINTNYQLFRGYVEAIYDAKNNMLVDLDEVAHGGTGVGDIRTDAEKASYKIPFPLSEGSRVVIEVRRDSLVGDEILGNAPDRSSPGGENELYTLSFTNSEGQSYSVETRGLPASVEDSEGSVFSVDRDEAGQAVLTPVSKASDWQLDPETMDRLHPEIARLYFRETENTRYAFDPYRPVYEADTDWFTAYKTTDEGFPADCKLIPVGKTDEISVVVSDTLKGFRPERVHFLTPAGKELVSRYADGRWILTLSASGDNDGQRIYAVYEQDGKKVATLGKLKVFSYTEKNVRVELIPVNGFRLDNEEMLRETAAIYRRVGVHCEIGIAPDFICESLRNKALKVDGSGFFSTLSPDMKALNEAYRQSPDYDPNVFYLFMIEQVQAENASGKVVGDMPRGHQFGYLFPGADARTAAHELGHGVFRLQHTFNYRFKQGELEDNLMDYPPGRLLMKRQWDMIHAPGLVIGVFEREEDGMSVTDDSYRHLINDCAKSIGAQLGVDVYAILHSAICTAVTSNSKSIYSSLEMPSLANLGALSATILCDKEKQKITTVLLVNITKTDSLDIPYVAIEKMSTINVNSTTSFLGILTQDSVYSCIPSENLSCDKLQKYLDNKNMESYLSIIFNDLNNCLQYNRPQGEKRGIGEAFLFTVLSSNPQKGKAGLEKIASSYNAIADLLFNGQVKGDEWERHGRYFMALYEAFEDSEMNLDDYLLQLQSFVSYYRMRVQILQSLNEDDAIAVFVSSFTDNELFYLPLDLRLEIVDRLTSKELNITVRDFLGDWRDDLRETVLLRLIRNLKKDEIPGLLDGLKKGKLLKAADSGMHDFITLFSDNYPEFIQVINEYSCLCNGIRANTYLEWMERLHNDNKSYRITEREGYEFVSGSCILENGKVKYRVSRATGETTTEYVPQGMSGYHRIVPVYVSTDVLFDYDEPIAIYHNKHIKGVDAGLLGTMEIVPAIQLHYYLGVNKDQELKDALQLIVDVASLAIGVGEINASVNGIRLSLALLNSASSVTSIVATIGESYLINRYGEDGADYVDALQMISAGTGMTDLGYNSVHLLKKVYSQELLTIGRFYKKNGAQLLSDPKTESLGKITRELYENFDADLLKVLNESSDLVRDLQRALDGYASSYPSLYNKIAFREAVIRNAFLADFVENTSLLKRFDADPDLIDAWQSLFLAGRSKLRTNVDAMVSLRKLMQNESLSKFGVSPDDFADMLKSGWGGEPQVPSFKALCDNVDELLQVLPDNTIGLKKYLGSAGFTNASKSTQRHAYVQLERLLENKTIMNNIQLIEFEKLISSSDFNIGTSVTDIHILTKNRTIIEIETKAGMEFFESLGGSSNFMVQSGNSLMKVSKIEDYKVFLNPGLIVDKQAAAKRVVDAWSKQGWFERQRTINKFGAYFQTEISDASELKGLLQMNTDWFDDIFTSKINIE